MSADPLQRYEMRLTSLPRILSVVLMDELDQLFTAKQDVVYNFFNWPTLPNSQLIVIAVANTMDMPEKLPGRVKSRMGEEKQVILHGKLRYCD